MFVYMNFVLFFASRKGVYDWSDAYNIPAHAFVDVVWFSNYFGMRKAH